MKQLEVEVARWVELGVVPRKRLGGLLGEKLQPKDTS
jgi:hypothetical protein